MGNILLLFVYQFDKDLSSHLRLERLVMFCACVGGWWGQPLHRMFVCIRNWGWVGHLQECWWHVSFWLWESGFMLNAFNAAFRFCLKHFYWQPWDRCPCCTAYNIFRPVPPCLEPCPATQCRGFSWDLCREGCSAFWVFFFLWFNAIFQHSIGSTWWAVLMVEEELG